MTVGLFELKWNDKELMIEESPYSSLFEYFRLLFGEFLEKSSSHRQYKTKLSHILIMF